MTSDTRYGDKLIHNGLDIEMDKVNVFTKLEVRLTNTITAD